MPDIRKLPYVIAVDFDGTLCHGNHYPYIGKPNHSIIDWVITQKQKGANIFLWTCRNN